MKATDPTSRSSTLMSDMYSSLPRKLPQNDRKPLDGVAGIAVVVKR